MDPFPLALREECAVTKTTHTERQILHHTPHATQPGHRLLRPLTAFLQQVLNAPIRIDLHGTQIGEALDQTRLFAKLLTEGIAQVVRGVGGDQQHGFAHARHLDGQRAGGGGFADAAFAADEDPAEGALVEKALKGGFEGVGVGVDMGGRHIEWMGWEGSEVVVACVWSG